MMQNKGESFFNTRDKVFNLIEKLKQDKIIKESKEASVTLPKELIIEEFDMVKFLNVAEIIEGGEISVSKSNLPKCERCQRFKKIIGLGLLCDRCLEVIRREKPKEINIEDYVKGFELNPDEESEMIKFLKDKK